MQIKTKQKMSIAHIQHRTITRTGITCSKIFCYMGKMACRWLIVENTKYFEVMLNIFEFSHMKEIVES